MIRIVSGGVLVVLLTVACGRKSKPSEDSPPDVSRPTGSARREPTAPKPKEMPVNPIPTVTPDAPAITPAPVQEDKPAPKFDPGAEEVPTHKVKIEFVRVDDESVYATVEDVRAVITDGGAWRLWLDDIKESLKAGCRIIDANGKVYVVEKVVAIPTARRRLALCDKKAEK